MAADHRKCMAYLVPFGLVVVAFYSLTIGIRSWQMRGTDAAPAFAQVMVMLAIWVAADAATLLGVGLEAKVLWYQVGFTDVTWLAAGWYAFTLQYSGGRLAWQRARWQRLACIGFCSAATALIWTNHIHHWLWTSAELYAGLGLTALELTNGPTFWLIYSAGHALLIFASVHVVRRLLSEKRIPPVLAWTILVGVLVPIGVSALYHMGRLLFDPSPYASAIAAGACEFAMRRYHFLTLVPIARERVFDSLEDAVVVIDSMGYVADVNPAACVLLGKDAHELVGSRAATMLDDQSPQTGYAALTHSRGALILQKADGPRYFDVRSSPVTGQSGADRIVVMRDVTEREEAARLLEHQALYDALTDLPNRALLRDRLEQAIQQGGSLALLLLDLDRFKEVNDTLGHQAGDQLLQQVAIRLRAALRAEDTAARLGGDEFAVLLEHVGSQAEAVALAQDLLSTFRAPLMLGGRELSTSLSIGVALGGSGQLSSEDLLRQADLALYSAKADGRGTYAVFEPALETLAAERLEIENDLRQALAKRELWLAYQPIFNLENGTVGEVEALLRWERPRQGAMSPAVFIPVAEETGLIVPIGQWVLEQACNQVRAWHEQYPRLAGLVMSVNLSVRQFQHPGLVGDVARTLAETGIDPKALKLEITESVLMQDVEAAVQTCIALKALGVQLAIDDFGTGYSSLAQLKRLPFDTLKIDRSFVDGLGRDEQDMAIVRSVVTLANTLRLSVTAEGIESPTQEAHLRSLGCQRGQGFLFARPQRSEMLAGLLAEEHAPRQLRAA